MEKDPIGDALNVFKARTLPERLQDTPEVEPTNPPNTVPERAEALAIEAEAATKELRDALKKEGGAKE